MDFPSPGQAAILRSEEEGLVTTILTYVSQEVRSKYIPGGRVEVNKELLLVLRAKDKVSK